MKTVLLIGHLLCAGLWLGCVLTEALFERALLGKGRDAERTLAALHWRVDVWVEVPAFTAVVLTGGLLWGLSPHTGLLYLKAGAAGVAVLANVWCVWLVSGVGSTHSATSGRSLKPPTTCNTRWRPWCCWACWPPPRWAWRWPGPEPRLNGEMA